MICPKCNKDTCVLITKQQKKRVRERTGVFFMILWIITFPFWGLWKLLFGRRQVYYKTQYWHCNYCNYEFPQKPDENQ